MPPFFPPLIAFLISVISTPFTIKFAKKFGLVDDAAKRPHPAHVHKGVIPRAGGLPIFLGIIITTIAFVPMDKHIIGILLGITVLLVMGLLDDYLKNFSPYPRLLLQFLAAAIVVGSGVGITFVSNPLGGILRLDTIVIPIEFFGTHNIVLIADIFAFLWIVWMMNMMNWSKGVDGQMPGIAAIAALTIGLLSYRLYIQGDPNQQHIAALSFITAGAAIGFLIFNWYPAKIFPGFSASNICGFMIAVLSILSGAKLATALLVLLIPTTDFFYTFFRRILEKKIPLFADQKHLHHMLLKRGWGQRRISLFYIFSCVILGVLAMLLPSQSKLFTLVGLTVASIGTILWIHLMAGKEEKDEKQ